MKWFARKKDVFDFELVRTCLSCEGTFQGKFCNRCGEKVVEPYDRSIKSFADNLLNALTFIDGKFYRSLKTLLLTPGRMSADIAIGRRQPYMKPVAFFFVGNFIYFLMPMLQTFDTPLYWQIHGTPYSAYANDVVGSYLQKSNLSMEAFTEKYAASSTNWAKIILIVLALLAFPFVVLINFTKRNYLSDHFLFSLEYSAYLIFVPTILYSLVLLAGLKLIELFGFVEKPVLDDSQILPFVIAIVFYFLLMGTRNFYKFPWWRVVISALLLTICMYFVINGYRFILFQVTMWNVA